MERGVYFDAWFPRQHCYHPSLPARRLKMVEDLVEYHATVLAWSAMGGGSISLPYLENEAHGVIDPRFRYYGYMNDSEFVRECQKHGIKVFGIVFEIQGWEFPVELNDREDQVLAMNELRGVGKPGWLGLREFTQNRYPRLWPAFETYFPDGLANGLGEPITNLAEDCCSRDIHGNALHARWVECPDRPHQCYLMDRNNPAWREYLKAVIRIQIDAGVDGIQLDEAELPITSIQYGGCFCKDCMAGFREYLLELPADQLPELLHGVDLTSFHYGEWLLSQGYDFQENREDSPMFWDYLRFQRGMITRYFAELADYARDYARSRGREVLVSGNFFNLFDHYYPLEPFVDMVITEMRNTRYQQPAWYRYAAGFVDQKPVVVVENPYGGVVPELAEMLKVGKGYDLFRMAIYEGAALGANMSLPYGSWMGSVIEDSFYAPHHLCVEVNQFLAEQEYLYSPVTLNDIAVIYSMESNLQRVAKRDLFADNRDNRSGGDLIPFWEVCEYLAGNRQPYDVVIFPDGDLRADSLHVDDLQAYRVLILPDCFYLTAYQAGLIRSFLSAGGQVLVMGALGTNLSIAECEDLLSMPGLIQLGAGEFNLSRLPGGPQIQHAQQARLAVNIQRVPEGAAVHLIRYDYDPEQDAVPVLPSLKLDLRLAGEYTRAEAYSPSGSPTVTMTRPGDSLLHLDLQQVPLYTVVLLRQAV